MQRIYLILSVSKNCQVAEEQIVILINSKGALQASEEVED
jgi:hypothetical protein